MSKLEKNKRQKLREKLLEPFGKKGRVGRAPVANKLAGYASERPFTGTANQKIKLHLYGEHRQALELNPASSSTTISSQTRLFELYKTVPDGHQDAIEVKRSPARTPQATVKPSSAVTPKPIVPKAFEYAPGLQALVEDSPKLLAKARQLSRTVLVSVTVPTVSGRSLTDCANSGKLSVDNVEEFRLDPKAAELATEALKRRGFDVVCQTDFALIAKAPAEVITKHIDEPLFLHARRNSDWATGFHGASSSFEPPTPTQLFVAPRNGPVVSASRWLPEGMQFIFSQPASPLNAVPSHVRPKPQNFFTADERVIRNALNVPNGYKGSGVTVAVVDSGFHPHPFYAAHNYKCVPVPTAMAPNPHHDSYGHGTAITSNLFAVAPEATVLGYKWTLPLVAGFESAAKSNAQIISCSWKTDNDLFDPVLYAAILRAIKNGKIVIFAAGNGTQAWPGSLQEVLSVGGVHCDEFGNLSASDYASGYLACTGRLVPDFCGLCGMRPSGVYIMMPTEPGSQLDTQYKGAPYPFGDETASGSGWVGASGTSSAAPMVAGVVALLLEKAATKGKTLTQEIVRKMLSDSARAVSAGSSAMGYPADANWPNLAVGHGLVNAAAALKLLD